MPLTIIETNQTPFVKMEVDPITLDIIESALRNARIEMDAVLYRTAMSPGIREQHDEFPMIASPEGKMVVGQFGSFIHGFKRSYDGTIEEGTIFLTSDPYSVDGAISHLNDWLVQRLCRLSLIGILRKPQGGVSCPSHCRWPAMRCTDNHLSDAALLLRRSWHRFRMVSPAGCPGFTGPIPQPVSMSCR